MDIAGAKIRIVISEPWDASRELSGTIVCPLTSSLGDTEYYLAQSSEGEWLTLARSHANESVLDVLQGRRVGVGIGIVVDPKVVEMAHFDADQVKYAYIGQIELVK